jgi:endogenous inhibitor of DNA gyrase (YacG/DUF329 family)
MSCPICGKPGELKYRPFCSRRCADRDLAQWLNGSYALPAEDPEDLENALEEVEKARSSIPVQ